MKLFNLNTGGLATAAALLAAVTGTSWAGHIIPGIPGPGFNLTAKGGYIIASDGNSIYMWSFANGVGPMQYPGPTLIVNQGQTVTVTLNNELPVPVSIVFPGQSNVTASGGVAGLVTRETPPPGQPGGPVTYQFVAHEPGTYLYHSGTRIDLQTEMGLVGALIVRPYLFDQGDPANRRAYAHADSQYDHEQLFLMTDMDERIHDQVELLVQSGQPVSADMTQWYPQYWFVNGRSGTDTILEPNAVWLPSQPYDALTVTKPAERVLMRLIGAGRDPHPFHHHGNDALVIARDGRFLSTAGQSGGMTGADLAYSQFTVPSTPGSTFDQIFVWTGEKLGWDIYGCRPGDPLKTHEYAPDHGKPFPVVLPSEQDITYGMLYSGSPFLGAQGALPPGEGGFNPGVFLYMWHSHSERELCDGNIFPGGMMTFLFIAPH